MSYIHVKVTAGAKKESFRPRRVSGAESPDHFLASLKEKPERNQANNRLLALVADYFKVPVGKVRIINGHKHPSKLIIVEL